MTKKQAFQILEVDETASSNEIKQAWKDMVFFWHPDRYQDNERRRRFAEEKTKLINEAFDRIQNGNFDEPLTEEPKPTEEKTTEDHQSFAEETKKADAILDRMWQSVNETKCDEMVFYARFFFGLSDRLDGEIIMVMAKNAKELQQENLKNLHRN